MNYFLEIEVGYEPGGIVLSQNKFTRDLLAGCPFDLSVKTITPLPISLKLQSNSGELMSDPELYKSSVGKRNYLTNTRPDLCYAVQVLSQYMQQPRMPHLQALIHTLRYVSHTVG